MRAPKNNDNHIRWLNIASIYVLILCIFLIFVFTVTDVVSTDLYNQVQDVTQVPIGLYKAGFAIFYAFGFFWMISEWYLGNWKRGVKRHNVAHNFLSLFIVTLVIIIYTGTQETGLFVFASFFTIIYTSALVLFLFHWISEYGNTNSENSDFRNMTWLRAPLGLFRTESYSSAPDA